VPEHDQAHRAAHVVLGVAGGDGRVISELIEYYFPDAILYKVG
jgi:hypothetical protein